MIGDERGNMVIMVISTSNLSTVVVGSGDDNPEIYAGPVLSSFFVRLDLYYYSLDSNRTQVRLLK